MKFHEFYDTLRKHQDKKLIFFYDFQPLRPDYHITEVKHVCIDSVNCGAGVEFWHETVIQLWNEPNSLGWDAEESKHMTVVKAMKILAKVDMMRTFSPNSEVKIEFSDVNLPLVQTLVSEIQFSEKEVAVWLVGQSADCKAKDVCGVKLDVVQPCCSPDSGCCS